MAYHAQGQGQAQGQAYPYQQVSAYIARQEAC